MTVNTKPQPLFEAIAEARKVRDKIWACERKVPPELDVEFGERCDDISVVAPDVIPESLKNPGLRRLLVRWLAFEDARAKFQSQAFGLGSFKEWELFRSSDVAQAFQSVVDAVDNIDAELEPALAPIESVKSLLEAGVGWRQVALIYSSDGKTGPFFVSGVPQESLVRKAGASEAEQAAMLKSWKDPRQVAREQRAEDEKRQISRVAVFAVAAASRVADRKVVGSVEHIDLMAPVAV
jgi:hypothetical protein